jgi:Domain of unknown function (DUF4386)
LLVKGFTVHGDAAATAQNFAAHEVAARASSALGLVSIGLYLALTALFYELFRLVSRRLSLVAMLLSVTACSIQAVGDVFLAQLQMGAVGQAGFGMSMHAQAVNSSLVLFGAFDVLVGVLILRSRFLPRVFGVLMVLAGLGWLVYLWPPLAARATRVVQPLGFMAEVVLMLWLLVKGVDGERWRELAES